MSTKAVLDSVAGDERFLDPTAAAMQLLAAAIRNDGKGVKIHRPDGSLETYVVQRVTWGDPREA